MKTHKIIFVSSTIMLISLFLSCCNKNNIEIYHSSYFDKNQKLSVNINSGEFVYNREFKEYFSDDKNIKIGSVCLNNERNEIYFKVDDKSSTFIIPTSVSKILLHVNSSGELNMYTERDSLYWREY